MGRNRLGLPIGVTTPGLLLPGLHLLGHQHRFASFFYHLFISIFLFFIYLFAPSTATETVWRMGHVTFTPMGEIKRTTPLSSSSFDALDPSRSLLSLFSDAVLRARVGSAQREFALHMRLSNLCVGSPVSCHLAAHEVRPPLRVVPRLLSTPSMIAFSL